MHVTEFATALADRLPGRWRPGPATTLIAQDAASNRIWDSGPLAYTAFEAADVQRCVLTSPHGLQLYVMPRPHRTDQYLVLPMLPAGTSHEHVHGLKDAPRGIAVPAHPARAAAAVRRRFLIDYRLAAMLAWRRASPGRLRVEIRFDAEARPRIRTTYVRALIELLALDGFLLDPATGDCHLPDTLTDEQASRQLITSLERVRRLGFNVSVRSSVPPGTPSRQPVSQANLPKGPSR
ncbi:hypothetical protein [Streptomyces sp. NPDC006355]|uniref:hypothetical protein n=1 Tax=Streptomyces sp. NPDC006355 TaxID=3156758 RepID=UPI0033AC357D